MDGDGMTMEYRNLATGIGGVSNPTDTRAEIIGRGVWTRCDACFELAFNGRDAECHKCGFTGRCHSCGTPIGSTTHFTAFTCSRHCNDELDAWRAADERIGR